MVNTGLYSAGPIFENLVNLSNGSACTLALPNTATVLITTSTIKNSTTQSTCILVFASTMLESALSNQVLLAHLAKSGYSKDLSALEDIEFVDMCRFI